MRLLFDENLSPRLVRDFSAPDVTCQHVYFCGLLGAPDTAIWAYARQQGYTLVTRDRDFLEYATRRGQPPKVVLLELANPANTAILGCLNQHLPALRQFCDAANDAVLILTAP